MQRLDDIMDFYLRMDTNNAIMLSGNWGAGKTYYFKNTLKEKISNTPVFKDNTKNYRPILVSLFGLKSVEEIQSEIFLCLFPYLKSAKLKLGATIGKAILKGILNLKGLGEYGTFVEGIEEVGISAEKKDLIKFEELVICFDDLERISPNLKIEELIGFINSLVESENVKVLIIANKGKGALSVDTYKDFEEKIIGNTIEFIPDLRTSYDSILKNKFTGYKVYKKFLEDNKEFVVNVFSSKSENLRTLIFALDYFHLIHSEINNNLFKNNNLKERKTEILLNLLKFSVAISIEYKESKISFKQRNELDDNSTIDLDLFFPYINQNNAYTAKEKEIEKKPREQFIENYYTDDKFIFYKSVYDYLTGGTTFDYSVLLEELQKIYHIQENAIPEQYEVINKLGYQFCFSFTNDEYVRLTRQMLEYAFKGSYDIAQYLTVFHFATRFRNPLKLNLDRLGKAIIGGMNKGKKNYKYNHSLGFNLNISSDTENQVHLKRIRKAALDLNNEILFETKSDESSELEKLCYNNFEEFSNKVLDNQQSFYFNSIFSNFKADRFYSYFYNSNPKQRWEIVRFFTSRYVDNPSLQQKADIPFLQKLNDRVKIKNIQLSGKNVTGFVYSELEKQLRIAIEKLNAAT